SVPGLLEKLREEGVWNGELVHYTKAGHALRADAVLEFESLDGRQLVLESTRDITDRNAWAERQRVRVRELRQQKRLVRLSHAPIFVWELGGGIIEWNRGCERLYGYSREEVFGKRKEQFLRTEVPGSSFTAMVEQLREEGVWSGELVHYTKAGRTL